MIAAALVKQVAALDGALVMDELCRQAVAQGVELAAAVGDGVCTAITLGPETAEDVLREAIAWGRTCNVMTDGVLLADAAFDGSDSLATARALAAVITREGPFDIVLLGAESSDVDTGQLGPQLAELLDLPFVAAARYLSMQGSWLHVRGQHEDGWMQATVPLPAIVSCAAGLIDPCAMSPTARALVPTDQIRTVTAADLGRGPWGTDASPTSVRSMHAGDVELPSPPTRVPLGHDNTSGAPIAVLIEPDRPDLARGLLGIAAGLADDIHGHVVGVTTESTYAASDAGAWGADAVVVLEGELVAEDVARGVADWAGAAEPWGVLAPSTVWGREVAGRAAARLSAGLAGNVDALAVDGGRLVAWKRTNGGRAVAEIVSSSTVQLATVRPEALVAPKPRDASTPPVETIAVRPRGRVRVVSRTRTGTVSP